MNTDGIADTASAKSPFQGLFFRLTAAADWVSYLSKATFWARQPVNRFFRTVASQKIIKYRNKN